MLKYLIYDTETTGLNIVIDKPFLFQYGLVDENLNLLAVELFDATNTASIKLFISYLKQVDTIIGHNIKFDIHMAINIGIDPALFKDKNYIDTAVLARLVISHDVQREASFSAALKKLALRYLGKDTADEERQLKAELSQLIMEHKANMKQYFIDKGLWDLSLNSVEETKVINEIYNNWNKVFHEYKHLKQARLDFLKLNPAPNYSNCSNIYTYGETDIRLTHGLFKLWYKEVVKLKQVPTLKRISAATFPYVMMERKGMVVNLKRLMQDRNAIIKELNKTHIIDPRNGFEYTIGQHAKLKELYEYETGMLLKNADKNTRKEIESKSPSAAKANYIAKMDKYLSSYITRILNKLCYIDGEYKVFTQYNFAGTVTGRLSSDFQQFPKEPLELDNGYVVNIRDWFIVPAKNKYMFYFDYSQMELRLQCEWTNIINGSPDLNMARAFSPYKCHCYDTNGNPVEYAGEPSRYFKTRDWYLDEDPAIRWEPTDLHALTTKHAFPGVNELDPDWNHYRQLGKRTNFAVNYGAAAPKIAEALNVDFQTAQALVDGYKKAFKGVVDFGKWLYKHAYTAPSTPNLLLRRYYSRNKHLLQNWLVQGSGADILLEKTTEVFKYIEDKPWWNLMLSVHDELGLTCDDIPKAQLDKEVEEIQRIMTYQLTAVDVTVDVEVTETSWADKVEY